MRGRVETVHPLTYISIDALVLLAIVYQSKIITLKAFRSKGLSSIPLFVYTSVCRRASGSTSGRVYREFAREILILARLNHVIKGMGIFLVLSNVHMDFKRSLMNKHGCTAAAWL